MRPGTLDGLDHASSMIDTRNTEFPRLATCASNTLVQPFVHSETYSRNRKILPGEVPLELELLAELYGKTWNCGYFGIMMSQ